jgi:hypothetical protein
MGEFTLPGALRRRVGLALSLLLLLPATQAMADEIDANTPAAEAGAAAEVEEEEEFYRHRVSVFLGGASRPEEHEDTEHGFAGGLEYEFRFSRWGGVGALAEAATGDLRDAVVAGLFYLHPWKGLLFTAGPGAELSSHGSEFLFRLGTGYEFEIARRFSITPNFNAGVDEGAADGSGSTERDRHRGGRDARGTSARRGRSRLFRGDPRRLGQSRRAPP